MTGRRYSRTFRVNELLREILADQLDRVDDERLGLVTISGVEAEPGLETAVVYFDALSGDDGDVVEAFEAQRVRLQGAIAREARLRNTPRLSFRPDHGIRAGERVDAILRGLHASGELPDEGDRADDEGGGEEPPTGGTPTSG